MLEVREHPRRGRGLYTTRHVPGGEVVLTEAPLLLLVAHAARETACAACLRHLPPTSGVSAHALQGMHVCKHMQACRQTQNCTSLAGVSGQQQQQQQQQQCAGCQQAAFCSPGCWQAAQGCAWVHGVQVCKCVGSEPSLSWHRPASGPPVRKAPVCHAPSSFQHPNTQRVPQAGPAGTSEPAATAAAASSLNPERAGPGRSALPGARPDPEGARSTG